MIGHFRETGRVRNAASEPAPSSMQGKPSGHPADASPVSVRRIRPPSRLTKPFGFPGSEGLLFWRPVRIPAHPPPDQEFIAARLNSPLEKSLCRRGRRQGAQPSPILRFGAGAQRSISAARAGRSPDGLFQRADKQASRYSRILSPHSGSCRAKSINAR